MSDFFNFLWLCLQNAFSFAWDAANIVSTIAELGVSAVILYKSKHEETAFKFGAKAVLWTFGIIFAGRLLLSPFFVWHELKSTDEAKYEALQKKYEAVANATPTQIDVHEADPEGRKQIAILQNQLDDYKKQIASAQERLQERDPLNQPIASATAEFNISIQSKAPIDSHFMDSGGFAAFAVGNTAILTTSANDSYGNQTGSGQVVYRGVFSMSTDDPSVGKPIISLKGAQYIQIRVSPMIPNSTVLRGTVVFTINGSTRLSFKVPPQLSGSNNDIFIHDLSAGMSALSPQ